MAILRITALNHIIQIQTVVLDTAHNVKKSTSHVLNTGNDRFHGGERLRRLVSLNHFLIFPLAAVRLCRCKYNRTRVRTKTTAPRPFGGRLCAVPNELSSLFVVWTGYELSQAQLPCRCWKFELKKKQLPVVTCGYFFVFCEAWGTIDVHRLATSRPT